MLWNAKYMLSRFARFIIKYTTAILLPWKLSPITFSPANQNSFLIIWRKSCTAPEGWCTQWIFTIQRIHCRVSPFQHIPIGGTTQHWIFCWIFKYSCFLSLWRKWTGTVSSLYGFQHKVMCLVELVQIYLSPKYLIPDKWCVSIKYLGISDTNCLLHFADYSIYSNLNEHLKKLLYQLYYLQCFKQM